MKSIIYGEVNRKTYYLGHVWSPFHVSYQFKERIDVYSLCKDKGEILDSTNFVEHKIIFETNEIKRELNIGEIIKSKGDEFEIKSKKIDVDGAIHYCVSYEELIDDEESKREAEKQLELREAFFRGILEEKERGQKVKETMKELLKRDNNGSVPVDKVEYPQNTPTKNKKKWFQFFQ